MAPSPSESGIYAQLRSKLLLPFIPSLDGIRAIAVFLVIFYHLGMELGLPILPGPLGVLAFFVLSGFLITWLLLKEEEKYGSISIRGFYRRRALRIFPAFYSFWFLAVALRLARGGEVPWSQAMSAFFYVSNYLHAVVRPKPEYMMHTWSLAIEEQFYLLWPLCFLAFSKKRGLMMAGLSIVIVSVWLHRIHLWLALQARDYISYAFDTRMDALLVGVLLAFVLKEGLGTKLVEWLCGPRWAPALTCSLLAISAFIERRDTVPSQAYRLTIGLTIEPFLVAVLICQLIANSDFAPWKWLNWKPILYLGSISYGLYLYHGLATAIATRVLGAHLALCVIATVFLSIFLASVSFRFIEQPFLALKHQAARHRAAVR